MHIYIHKSGTCNVSLSRLSSFMLAGISRLHIKSLPLTISHCRISFYISSLMLQYSDFVLEYRDQRLRRGGCLFFQKYTYGYFSHFGFLICTQLNKFTRFICIYVCEHVRNYFETLWWQFICKLGVYSNLNEIINAHEYVGLICFYNLIFIIGKKNG